jgi:hypothetical protein
MLAAVLNKPDVDAGLLLPQPSSNGKEFRYPRSNRLAVSEDQAVVGL